MFRTSSVHHQQRFVQAVFADTLVCGNTRTTRHAQPLRLDVSSSTHSSTTYQSLMMDRLGPKHVELT